MIDAGSNSTSEALAQRRKMHVCSKIFYDETIPGLTFDEKGVCNLARDCQWRLQHGVFRGADGQQRLEAWAELMKVACKGRDYDCII